AVGSLQSADRSSGDRRQLQRIASVERQIGDVADTDNLRDARIVRLDGGSHGFDCDRLIQRAHRQRDIVSHHLVDVHDDAGLGDLLKTGLLYCQVIDADANEVDRVKALQIRRLAVSVASSSVHRGYLGAEDAGPVRIGYGSGQ